MSEELSVADMMGGFDPFGLRTPAQVEATGSAPEQTAPEQTVDSGASEITMDPGAGEQTEQGADPAAVDPNAVAQPAPDPQATRDALLAQQAQAIQHMLAQQQAAAQQQTQPGAQTAPAPMFQVSVPPAVADAIFSQDPAIAKQGLDVFTNMAMNTVAERVMAAIQQKMEGEYFQRITGHMQTTQQQQATIQQTEAMFYSANPHLKTPVGRQVATAVTQQMAQENPAQFARGLTPELVAQIAKRADEHLASMGYVRQQPAQRPAAGFVAGNGARPPAQPKSLLDDMLAEFPAQ